MGSSPLAETYNLMLEFGRAVSIEAVYGVLLTRCQRYGVESVLAGVIPQRIVHPSEQPGYVILGHWPMEWAERYFSRQYVRRDPTILHCSQETNPLVWDTIRVTDAAAKRIMDEARDFRLLDGITIPQLSIQGTRIGVSFAGRRLDKTPTNISELTVLASYAVTRALELHARSSSAPVPLTIRERECLLWMSEGKTIADTAAILGVTDSSIEKHLSAARGKLKSLSTVQSVAIALRQGFI